MELAFVLLGSILVTYGWYWGGVTEARTSAYAMGTGSILLGLYAAFNPESIEVWSLFAVGAGFGILATANAWNESTQDRTYGMFALLFGFVAILVVAADNDAAGQLTDAGVGALVLTGIAFLHFVSAALVPANKGFKALAGWITLGGGAFLVFLGFADAIGTSIT